MTGDCKIPIGNYKVSFKNRPFPIDQVAAHCERFQNFGINCIRLLITWEAIEHLGPGKYDSEYLNYLHELIDGISKFNSSNSGPDIYIYIDPHQDVWSRFSGGDGAPKWTFDAVGMDVEHFESVQAALLRDQQQPMSAYPKMIWPTNYFKFACATMFTIFFAGNTFAPNLKSKDGVPMQDYLQSHYCNAIAQVAKIVANVKNGTEYVLGFGTMNEPSSGYVNVLDLNKHFSDRELKYGYAPTPFQGMCLANGISQKIEYWSNGIRNHVFHMPDKIELMNTNEKSIWKHGASCVWEQHGVYSMDNGIPTLQRPHYFADFNFGTKCYLPFAKKFENTIQKCLAKSIIFVELPPLEFAMSDFPSIDNTELSSAVNATHWYDGVTLFLGIWFPYASFDTRTNRPVLGKNNVFNMKRSQLRDIKRIGQHEMHNAPSFIGETGIPFSLNGNKSFRSGDYSAQVSALDSTINALEANLLSFTLWCYTPGNSNVDGDFWNNEDLSVVSTDLDPIVQPIAYQGCRAAKAWIRPYAYMISGKLEKNSFSLDKVEYVLQFSTELFKGKKLSSEIFVPKLHYACQQDLIVDVSDGDYVIEECTWFYIIKYSCDFGRDHHRLSIRCRGEKGRSCNIFWWCAFAGMLLLFLIQ